MKSFHVVWARNVQECSLKSSIGKARYAILSNVSYALGTLPDIQSQQISFSTDINQAVRVIARHFTSEQVNEMTELSKLRSAFDKAGQPKMSSFITCELNQGQQELAEDLIVPSEFKSLQALKNKM